jgi:crotonobetainyl-CoA:carnitine CoA-transferase CaiB-like acyl-CoA transferase
MDMDSTTLLNDVRVLDASRVLAGPFCGQLLADLGAEVIKLERPGMGDETRYWGPPFWKDLSAYFLSCNRGKKAITLDLSQPEGRDILHELLQHCDVLIENFRSDSAEHLGLIPDVLRQQHPRLIHCAISGFGRTGPWRERPGYDFAIQAMSGLMAITGPVEGPPCKVGVAVTDVLTGLYAATAILACLHARKQSGHGYAIDLALLDCAVAAQVNVAQAYLSSGQVPPRQGNAHLQIVPYQLFATADHWLVLAIGNDSQWRAFCHAAARDDLAADPRFLSNDLRVRHRDELVPLVADIMKSRTTAEWKTLLESAKVPHAEVCSYDRVFSEPQLLERGMRMTIRDAAGHPVDLVGSPFHIYGAATPTPRCPPRLGEHTESVLREWLTLNSDQLADLRRRGVI